MFNPPYRRTNAAFFFELPRHECAVCLGYLDPIKTRFHLCWLASRLRHSSFSLSRLEHLTSFSVSVIVFAAPLRFLLGRFTGSRSFCLRWEASALQNPAEY